MHQYTYFEMDYKQAIPVLEKGITATKTPSTIVSTGLSMYMVFCCVQSIVQTLPN